MKWVNVSFYNVDRAHKNTHKYCAIQTFKILHSNKHENAK